MAGVHQGACSSTFHEERSAVKWHACLPPDPDLLRISASRLQPRWTSLTTTEIQYLRPTAPRYRGSLFLYPELSSPSQPRLECTPPSLNHFPSKQKYKTIFSHYSCLMCLRLLPGTFQCHTDKECRQRTQNQTQPPPLTVDSIIHHLEVTLQQSQLLQ